ncbi:hypothetical protein LAWI1_G001753 [Lachnellula willkommii]|uniref:Uncharacterized protein n=1 Tax=Lachnellula willkommii TaxID=215461 RepID=A0A559MGP2_9HELO|nr:hypothetical protein LAWI1_G001753 [Lachnellula willkommii]
MANLVYKVKINCDMGRGFGKWKMGPDEDSIKYFNVTSHEYCVRVSCQELKSNAANSSTCKEERRPSTSGSAGLAGIW